MFMPMNSSSNNASLLARKGVESEAPSKKKKKKFLEKKIREFFSPNRVRWVTNFLCRKANLRYSLFKLCLFIFLDLSIATLTPFLRSSLHGSLKPPVSSEVLEWHYMFLKARNLCFIQVETNRKAISPNIGFFSKSTGC